MPVHILLKDKQLVLAGDGGCDSPGHNAKYGTYTMMDTDSKLIVDCHLVQAPQTTSSVAMEKLGFKIVMNRLLDDFCLTIKTVVTDRSPQVKTLMKKEFSNIKHQFDIWHFGKSIYKKNKESWKEEELSVVA